MVAGSKSAGMSKVPVIIDLASSSSPRYLSWSPSSVDMIGAQKKSDFAFPLNCILQVFLDGVFFGFTTEDLLNLQYTQVVRIPNGALDEIPHLLALFSIDSLLDVPHMIVLLLGLSVNETVLQVYLPESFSLLLEFCFSNLAVSETVF